MMRKNRISLFFLTMAFSILACNLGALISPEVLQINNSGAATIVPTDTFLAIQSATIASASKLEIIHIAQPAPNSTINSPVKITGEADSTFEQNLVITISGEDGSQLALIPTTIQSPLGSRGNFVSEISFSVTSAQAGRISVYSVSAMTGGLEHLSSVEVTLSPTDTSTSSVAVSAETIDILLPKALDIVSGGVIQISGFSEYFFESSLAIILCGAGASGSYDVFCGSSANIIASGNASINSQDVGQAGPFSATLNYSHSVESPGRLIIYAISPRDGGILHLNSIPLQIKP